MCQCSGLKKTPYDSFDAFLCRICLAKSRKAIKEVDTQVMFFDLRTLFFQKNILNNKSTGVGVLTVDDF